MTRQYFKTKAGNRGLHRHDDPRITIAIGVLLNNGFVRSYVIDGGAKHAHKRFRIAFAHPRKRIAIEIGRDTRGRDAALRSLGWRVIRLGTGEIGPATFGGDGRSKGPVDRR